MCYYLIKLKPDLKKECQNLSSEMEYSFKQETDVFAFSLVIILKYVH